MSAGAPTPAGVVQPHANSNQQTSVAKGVSPRAGGSWCSDSRFGWPSFESMRRTLDNRFPINRRQVWQAPNNDAVWDIWCMAKPY